jgi:hypothetical protein
MDYEKSNAQTWQQVYLKLDEWSIFKKHRTEENPRLPVEEKMN